MGKYDTWNDWQLKYVDEHYPYERAEDVGKAIGKSTSSVMYMAHSRGIYKDKEALHRIKSIANSGENSGNFKGYVQKTQEGYVVCRKIGHPSANGRGYVKRSRLVVEENLGFILPKEFVVHHINGIKDDDRIENLAIMTKGAHSAFHGRAGRNIPKGAKHYRFKELDVEEMRNMRSKGYTVERICKSFGITKQTYYKRMERE